MGERLRAIYMGGPVTGLEQLLEVRSVADAVTVSQYQQSASASDVQAIAAVRQRRQELSAIAAALAAQRREQEQFQDRLDGQRRDIEARLADQQRFLDRLSADVKRAVLEEQQRQENLRRAALARKLAAEKAAREAAAEKAARDRAAKDAAARAAASRDQSSGGSGDSGSSASSGSASSGSSGGSTAAPAPRSSGFRSTHGSSRGSASAPSSAAARAVAYARAQLGKPYLWSAEGPSSFDCSGLTMMAWRGAGVSIPRTSRQQFTIGRHISQSNLEPGDLVFFGSPIHHVGMYVGNGTMIEAPYTGQVVRFHSINRSDYAGATRPTG
jgi:cell wall-associated NlpC family hydrolase